MHPILKPITVFILLWQAQTPAPPTKVDLVKHSQRAQDVFSPGYGTMLVCSGGKCVSAVTGEAVMYRTTAPMSPGPCVSQGTGAIAMDAAGYLYVCGAGSKWRRTATPLVEVW